MADKNLVTHIINKNIFILFSQSCNKNVFAISNVKTLFTNLPQKHPHRLDLQGCCNYMKKNHPGETGFLICKNEISVMKNVSPSREGKVF